MRSWSWRRRWSSNRSGATRPTTPRAASLSTTLVPYLQRRFRSIGHFRTVYELRYVSQKWWSSRKWKPRMQSAAHIGATESHSSRPRR